MILYGNLFLFKEFVFCGHPGLSSEIYRFKIDKMGCYDVYVKERSNNLNKPSAVKIQISLGVGIDQPKGQLIQSNLSNQCHGGVMICSSEKFSELEPDFEVSSNLKLWNYFSDGVA